MFKCNKTLCDLPFDAFGSASLGWLPNTVLNGPLTHSQDSSRVIRQPIVEEHLNLWEAKASVALNLLSDDHCASTVS